MHNVTWSVAVAIYLFVAGVGVAAFYTGILADLFSKGEFRPMAKYGSFIGFPLMLVGVLMLLLDLGKPFKFWLLLINFRISSTESLGAWLILVFTVLVGLNALTWLAEADNGGKFVTLFKNKKTLRRITGLLGLPVGVLTAGYSGVVLASTSSPLWSSTPYIGLLFLASATATGIAALILIAIWRKENSLVIQKLAKAVILVIVFEIIVFCLLLITLWSAAPEAVSVIISGSYAPLFWLGVIACGLVIPLVIELHNVYSSKKCNETNAIIPVMASVLILAGAFLLRYVILYAGQVL